MVLAVIPARGGSKRVEKKNIRNFCGKPLISYAIETAKKSNLFNKIHVSTDDEQIKQVTEAQGLPVDFLRSASLADENTILIMVLKWVLQTYIERGEDFQDICLLLATAPLVMETDLQASYKLFLAQKRLYPVLALGTYSPPIEWAYKEVSDSIFIPIQPDKLVIRSQDIVPHYYGAGAFVWFSKEHILSLTGHGVMHKVIGYKLKHYQTVDIDTIDDFELAELIMLGLQAKKNDKK